MLLQEGGFTGTHLWLKSFLGLPQLINHRLVGVLGLGCSLHTQPACRTDMAALPSPVPRGLSRSENWTPGPCLRFS